MAKEQAELNLAQETILREALGVFFGARWAKELIGKIQQHSADEITRNFVTSEVESALRILNKRFGEDEQAFVELLEKKDGIINALLEVFGQQKK